jgi:vanillate O-demethylase ferredoxin subunit
MASNITEVWQDARVVETVAIAPRIRRIVLEPARPVPVSPGAHIDARVRIADSADRRSYSVVDAAPDGRHLAVSVFDSAASRGGAGYMHSLRPGDHLEITQPLVSFPLRIGAPRYVLLAGGIGITAVLGMAAILRSLHADYRLVYVGRSREAMAYLDELSALHGDRLQVHIGSEGVPLVVPELVGSIDPETELYMCGPIRLMDAVRRAWVERELPLPNLRFETFGNSGWHEAQEFVVRIPERGLEITVGADQTMLEALEAAGADMMFDCRKGECGLCEVRVLGLQGGIDHRDVFYSERQKDARSKLCCCVSRVVSTGSAGPALISIESS